MLKPLALIIEDDSDVAELFSHVLRLRGCDTEIMHTGEMALKRLATIAPDMVCLDLMLPHRVSGIDILQQIRADKRLAQTRVVVITAHPSIAETIEDTADQVLLKPIHIDQLGEQVTHLRSADSTSRNS